MCKSVVCSSCIPVRHMGHLFRDTAGLGWIPAVPLELEEAHGLPVCCCCRALQRLEMSGVRSAHTGTLYLIITVIWDSGCLQQCGLARDNHGLRCVMSVGEPLRMGPRDDPTWRRTSRPLSFNYIIAACSLFMESCLSFRTLVSAQYGDLADVNAVGSQ